MSEPADLLEPIIDETRRTLEEMGQTKDLQQRHVQSEIVRNLCQSLSVFFELMSSPVDEDDLAEFLEDEED